MRDRFDLTLSTTSQAAADAYVRAVDNLLAAGADLVEGFDAALVLDPGFALAHIGRARCLATYARGAEAREAAARADACVAGASARERSHVAALTLQIHGRGAEALAAIRTHLTEYPRDAMVLQPATGIFGLIGFSGRMEREVELLAILDGLAPHYGDEWWFASIHAFAECEAGRLAQAEARIERALAAAPRNGNAAHVKAHVHYELDQPGPSAGFLRDFLAAYPANALLRGHLSWHLALLELGAGNAQAAHALYADAFGAPLDGRGPPTPPLNVLTDAVSWLWRTELVGDSPHSSDWPKLAAYARERFPSAGIAFADLHAAAAYARAGQGEALERLIDSTRALGVDRPALRAAGALGEGLAAYARGDWQTAARLLAEYRDENARVGGSHAQRELVDRTLLQALARLDDTAGRVKLSAARTQILAGV
ncbi:MAG: hypothetical protein JNM79_09655 [Burkholderiales bacterium]|nr:hypothetical protein [Burkholderiales bacterium]